MNTNTNSQPKNKLKILIIVIVAILLIVAIAISWIETYWYYVDKMILNGAKFNPEMGVIMMIVDKETETKIKQGEITIEDFGSSNIKEIRPTESSIEITDRGFFLLLLKSKNERTCKKTLLQVMKLSFVIDAYPWI